MRRKTLIFLSLFVIVFVVAEVPRFRFPEGGREDSVATDSVVITDSMIEAAARRANEFVRRHDSLKAVKAKKDSLDSLYAIPGYLDSIKRLTPDTAGMDSLHKAIWAHNKQIDDSLRADSLNRQRKSGIDAPVEYSAEDSMVYMGDTKLAYLFGKSHVK